ncbi:MAG: DUF4838 domain-containing protein [Planctomycetota bacterium]
MRSFKWFVLCAVSISEVCAAHASALTLVKDGQPKAVIVTANKVSSDVQKAADEIQYYIKRMSGAKLDIINERALGATRKNLILVGTSNRVNALNVLPAELEPEMAVRVVKGNALVIMGENRTGSSGVLHAAYGFLQDQLGCRWVWPGKSGEVIPKTTTVEVADDLNVVQTPKLIRRHYRLPFRPSIQAELDDEFPRFMKAHEDTYDRMSDEASEWYGHMRLGSSDKPRYGHAFTRWYDRYFDKYPEIFALTKNGNRGLVSATHRKDFVKMCPSSDQLVDMLIEQFMAVRAKNPRYRWLNACENDGGQGFCTCEKCLASDLHLTDQVLEKMVAKGWDREYIKEIYGTDRGGMPRSLSNRYFTFYNKLARRLREVAPDAYVVVYAYARYKYVPVNLKLEPNILVGLVGFNGYPMTEEQHASEVRNFMAWKNSGIDRTFFRPNTFFFSIGHGVPWDATPQMAGDFEMLVKNGIMATDYDILNGHWSTAAPTYYSLARLQWDTDMTAEQVMDEFYGAFGPAADNVKDYFAYWADKYEKFVNRPDYEEFIRKAHPHGRQIGARRAVGLLFGDKEFAEARAILDAGLAKAEAIGDEELLQRLHVLELGLRHGELTAQCARFAINYNTANQTMLADHWPVIERLFKVREELAELGAHDIFWLNYFETRYHDMYFTRAYHDFYQQSWKPVLVTAEDDWRFCPDPTNKGEAGGWQNKDLKEPKRVGRMDHKYHHLFFAPWNTPKQVKAWKQKAKVKNLEHGWYSIDMSLPQEVISSQSVLYFPYFKGSAKIWINGKLIKSVSARQGAEKATTIPVEKVGIQAGQPFKLTVKVDKPGGAGGMIGPVYVAVPENM